MQNIHHSPHHKMKDQAAGKSQDEQQAAAADTEHLYAKVKPRRTPGLRLFDIGLYPLLSNFAVFAVSVVFTFLTARGGDKKADGELVYGKIGRWFQWRGEEMEGFFQRRGLKPKDAEMAKIVSFSFIDGSIMAIPVKWFEDRREKIAHWIDEKLGTVPADMSPYEAEPKQSWLSVLGGRFITAGIVVPTAILLSRKVAYRPVRNPADPLHESNPYMTVSGSKTHENNTSWNDIAFNDLSEQHAERLPSIKRFFSKAIDKMTGVKPGETISVPEVQGGQIIHNNANQGDTVYKTIARMTYFEAFYTSVCTAGLYISSRILASFFGKRDAAKAEKAKHEKDAAIHAVVAETKPVITPTKIEIPREPEGPAKRVHTQALEAERFSRHEHALDAQPALHGI